MKRVQHSFVQTNAATPERVFPLLCPVREAEWVPGWEYRLVYSRSGVAELGCVFTTPNEKAGETTWVVTEYEPDMKRIAFAWVWPGMVSNRLTIRLEPQRESQTRAEISYEYTALSEEGERELDRWDEAWFTAKMKGWEVAINHYLRTGKLVEAQAWE